MARIKNNWVFSLVLTCFISCIRSALPLKSEMHIPPRPSLQVLPEIGQQDFTKLLRNKNRNLKLVKNSRLSHVIMPFVAHQVECVVENIRRWKKFPPCIRNNIANKENEFNYEISKGQQSTFADNSDILNQRSTQIAIESGEQYSHTLCNPLKEPCGLGKVRTKSNTIASTNSFGASQSISIAGSNTSHFQRNQSAPENTNETMFGIIKNLKCPSDVEFVFYTSCNIEDKRQVKEIEIIEKKLHAVWAEVLEEPGDLSFSGYQIIHAGIDKNTDSYFSGSRIMLERMLGNRLALRNAPSYVMYMEPDCHPIRSHWLAGLAEQVSGSSLSPFWIKGSIFRGGRSTPKCGALRLRFHLNGNALYNLGDEAFRIFYFRIFKPWCRKQYKGVEGAFDTRLFQYLMESDESATVLPEIWHMFHSSEFIMNYSRTPYSVKDIRNKNPFTFLVHGQMPNA